MRNVGFRLVPSVPQVNAMRIVRSALLLTACSSLVVAAACSTGRTTTAALAPPSAPVKKAVVVEKQQPKANPNAALNGRWEPTDADGRKLYYLQLKNGGLASRSPSTNATTARGTYKVLAGNKVAIVYQSSQSSTPINLTCQVAGGKRMTCSSADGSNTFSIVKAA